MTVSENGMQNRRTGEAAPTDVLDTFATYQGKTAEMVADEFGIDPETAVILLDELAARGSLTKARAHTPTPVWLLPHPRREESHEQ